MALMDFFERYSVKFKKFEAVKLVVMRKGGDD